MRLNEVLCIEVHNSSVQTQPNKFLTGPLLIMIKLVAVRKVYPYQSSYKFGEAWLSEGQCECQCGSFNYKPKCPQGLIRTCFDVKKEVVLSDGQCEKEVSHDPGRGTVSCTVDVIHQGSRRSFRAVEIDGEEQQARYEVKYLALTTGVVLETVTFDKTLSSNITTDLVSLFSVQFWSILPTVGNLKPGWYFGAEHTSELKFNAPLNSDSEWNVRKLGWTRLGENGGVETRGDSISTAVRFTVDNCQLQLIHTEFLYQDEKWYTAVLDSAEHVSHANSYWADKLYRNDTAQQVVAEMKKPGGVTTQIRFDKQYKSYVYRDSFSPSMFFNFTLRLPETSKTVMSPGNVSSPDNVTSPGNVTSSLELQMEGFSGVVIVRIVTHEDSREKWGGRTSYVYIPGNLYTWTHHVTLNIGDCDMVRVEVCLRGLFSSKRWCKVKNISCRGEDSTVAGVDEVPIRKNLAEQNTSSLIVILLGIFTTQLCRSVGKHLLCAP
ncbi:hypothetical protein ACHWQZ_G006333 [Mnemiopsis leidyi]